MRGWVAQDAAAAAGLVDAAKSSGYRYVPVSVRVPRKLPAHRPFKVRTTWRNDGSAPTYDDWRVTLQLRKQGPGRRQPRPRARPAHRAARHHDARKRSLDLGKLRRGRYTLWVTVTDPVGYLAPMNLAIAGRSADGAYRIGEVRVARRDGH